MTPSPAALHCGNPAPPPDRFVPTPPTQNASQPRTNSPKNLTFNIVYEIWLLLDAWHTCTRNASSCAHRCRAVQSGWNFSYWGRASRGDTWPPLANRDAGMGGLPRSTGNRWSDSETALGWKSEIGLYTRLYEQIKKKKRIIFEKGDLVLHEKHLENKWHPQE